MAVCPWLGYSSGTRETKHIYTYRHSYSCSYRYSYRCPFLEGVELRELGELKRGLDVVFDAKINSTGLRLGKALEDA